MNILEKFRGFDIIKDTVFLKDFSKDNLNLKKLESLFSSTTDSTVKNQIGRDISFMKWGLEGENNVYFELKNSLLPMICLHDIRIQARDLFAQIDFLILTNKFFCILETKHLVGDIKVDSEGNFIRVITDELGVKKEEGIYNPVTQGERHSRILRKFLEDNELLSLSNFPIKSLAILANPKTILNKENAPENIKNSIIRYDQIVHYLQREFYNPNYDLMISDSKLDYIGSKLVEYNKPILFDYESKYKLKSNCYSEDNDSKKSITKNNFSNSKDSSSVKSTKKNIDSKDSSANLESELKQLRREKSKELNIKAYELFKNDELSLLLKYLPKNTLELNKLNIIPKRGSSLIGKDIVDIINKYNNKNTHVDKAPNNTHLKKLLENYRRKTALDLNLQEFNIFTNIQLNHILETQPKTISDLSKIKGLSHYQISKYGSDILSILKQK